MSFSSGHSSTVAPVLNWKNLNLALNNLAKRIFNLEAGTGIDAVIGDTITPTINQNGAPGLDPRNFVATVGSAPIEQLTTFPIPTAASIVPANLLALSTALNASKSILNGSTSGTFYWSMPFQDPCLGLFIGYYNNYLNNSAFTPQTINFPTAFLTDHPHILFDAAAGYSNITTTTTAAVKLVYNMASVPVTGYLILLGF